MSTLKTEANNLKAKLYRGFADPSRLSSLEALRAGPLTVSAIVAKTGLSRTNVCNHLRCLADCNLVLSTPHGRYHLTQLSHPNTARTFDLTGERLRDVAGSL